MGCLRLFISLIVLVGVGIPSAAIAVPSNAKPEIERELLQILETFEEGEEEESQEPKAKIPVLIHLKDRYDLSKLPKLPEKNRGRALAKILETHTRKVALKAYPFLETEKDIENLRYIWLTHSISVKATKEVIEKLVGWADSTSEALVLDLPKGVSELEDGLMATLVPRRVLWDETTPVPDPTNPTIGWGVEKLGATQLWSQGIEGAGVTVAVIDSGAALTHPDIAPSVWQNKGEMGNGKETNGKDDDKNGFVDDVTGWNFDQSNNDVTDVQGHGSQTAGLVGGVGTSGIKTGVAPKAKLMILKACCTLQGEVGEGAIFQAIQYAVREGAQVISMSLSVKHFASPNYLKWRQASEVVLKAGVIHVNSAGNMGKGLEPNNIGAPASNPPAWFHPDQIKGDRPTSMITIGATDDKDVIRPYSGVGPVSWENIEEYKDFPYEKGLKPGLIKPDVCGPSEVPSTSKDGKTYTKSFGGTSSATPQIAGTVALLLSANKKLTIEQMTEALQMSALTVGTKFNNECGAGRVDAVKALEYVKANF